MVALKERPPIAGAKISVAERLKRLGNEQRHAVAGLVLLLTDPEIPRDVKRKVTEFVEIGVERIREGAGAIKV